MKPSQPKPTTGALARLFPVEFSHSDTGTGAARTTSSPVGHRIHQPVFRAPTR